MAKILKIAVGVTEQVTMTPAGPRKGYVISRPPECDVNKIEIMFLECTDDFDAFVARGDGLSYTVGVVSDADAPAFLASKDIVELTEEEATTLGVIMKPQREIYDNAIIAPIFAKQRAAMVLTQEELDALDPDNPAKGITMSAHFSTKLSGVLAKVG